MSGYRTYAAVAAGLILAVLGMFHITVGVDKDVITGVIEGLILIAIGFNRAGSKTDAANATMAITSAVTNNNAKAQEASAAVGATNIVAADLPRTHDVPVEPKE